MKVLFKKLKSGAILPKKATPGSAAYDLYVPEDFTVKRGRQIIPLGFAMEMPLNIEALIDARSGFSSKGMEGFRVEYIMTNHGFELEKTPKICEYPQRFDCDVLHRKLDATSSDEVEVIINNRSPYDFVIKAGTHIADFSFHRVEEVEFVEN